MHGCFNLFRSIVTGFILLLLLLFLLSLCLFLLEGYLVVVPHGLTLQFWDFLG